MKTRTEFLIELFFQLFNLDSVTKYADETLPEYIAGINKIMDASGVKWFYGLASEQQFAYEVNTIAMGKSLEDFTNLCFVTMDFSNVKKTA